MPIDPDSLTSIADVTASTATEGTITVNLGDQATGQGYGSEASVWGTPGFYGRPADPDAGGCAQALWITEGNQKRAVAFRDRRAQALLPQIKPGESVMYGHQGQFIRTRIDGSIIASTTDDGTINGRSIYAKIAPDGVEVNTPWARLNVGANGIDAFHTSGATFTLGAVGGVPDPLGSILTAAGITSYASLDAGMVAIKAGILSLGTDGGAGNEAAVTALKAVVTAFETVIAALIVDLSTATGAGATGAAANTSTLLPAIAAFQAIASAIGKVV